VTGAAPETDNVIVRYYIDNDPNATIEFRPNYACGVAFGDDTNPWGTKWAGKGSTEGGWFHNFKIPFYSSLRVTYQSPVGSKQTTAYFQVRGVENLPITLEGVTIPTGVNGDPKAKMQLQINDVQLQPLEFLDLVSVPAGNSAYVFQFMLSFAAPTPHTIEGCAHWYGTASEAWPGTLLATGTEDWFDSSHTFTIGNGSTFHFPVSGLTHFAYGPDRQALNVSAYRYQDMDPLIGSDGARLQWRNGDMRSKTTGEKCFTQSDGNPVGQVGVADVLTYAWVYVW
jgi:hypothetical protein